MLDSSNFTEELIFTALKILKENGCHMSSKDLMHEIYKVMQLNEWATSVSRSTGRPRWQTILSFRTVPCVKSGYLIKKRGEWKLTKKGEEVLKFGPVELAKRSKEQYAQWAKDNSPLVVEGKRRSTGKEK
ncbi:MAG: winged helix-turn-helix domain-containing protein [bacterium]